MKLASSTVLKRKQAKLQASIDKLTAIKQEVDEQIKVEDEPSASHRLIRGVCDTLPGASPQSKERAFCIIRNRIDSIGVKELVDFKQLSLVYLLAAPRVSDDVVTGILFDLRDIHKVELSTTLMTKEHTGIVIQEQFDTFLNACRHIYTSKSYFEMFFWVAKARNVLGSYKGKDFDAEIREVYKLTP